MHPLTLLLATLTVTALPLPLPLNINLGAYSPAMVVGDGAISFEDAKEGAGAGAGEGGEAAGGTPRAENLIHTLQGGSSNQASRGITSSKNIA
ncbi:hypothetical protein B0T20DRAFT_478173 [Sordaria brevicollis]|uniref:Uncharacterized protein n=1 Tax=Sordaria brevicollis TaxID=83679 RepID=A0AAE0PI25_SORBR|nr:hypothetical protein B0T20DRAFT_478173 [Sordaria brevicollis]